MYNYVYVYTYILHAVTNIYDAYRSLLTHIEDGEEFPAVVDVGGALVVKKKPEQQ